MTSFLPELRECSDEEILAWLEAHGQPPYRMKQIKSWFNKVSTKEIDQMRNLPSGLRGQLSAAFGFHRAELVASSKSKDGSEKCLIRFADGNEVEGVSIPSGNRTTACISTQAGCALGCRFCATGTMGLTRNLTSGEMVDQVLLLWPKAGRLSNIVYMGMGEPMLNYRNVSRSLKILTKDMAISPSRITVSTAGIAKGIIRLAEDHPKVNLALSLHAADTAKRSVIMPVNKRDSLSEVMGGVTQWHKKTGKRITYEYVLIQDVNDGVEDRDQLIRLARQVPAKINLLYYNPVPGMKWNRPNDDTVRRFAEKLKKERLLVQVRRSRGRDIAAACGQLAAVWKPKANNF